MHHYLIEGGTGECKKCDINISDDQNYCAVHYQEALAEYEVALAKYNAQVERWNALSDEEKGVENQRREESKIQRNSALVGVMLGGLAWYSFSLQWLSGLGLTTLCILGCTRVKPVQSVIGKGSRALVIGGLYFSVLWSVGAVLSIWVESLQKYQPTMSLFLLIACLSLSTYLEIKGRHQANAAPSKPPKRPSR